MWFCHGKLTFRILTSYGWHWEGYQAELKVIIRLFLFKEQRDRFHFDMKYYKCWYVNTRCTVTSWLLLHTSNPDCNYCILSWN